MTTWRELLDSYERTIATVEASLGSADVPPTAPTWSAPSETPTVPPCPDDRSRLTSLHGRAARCQRQLDENIGTIVAELGTVHRTVEASRHYARVTRLAADAEPTP